jgi:hypothetical protein
MHVQYFNTQNFHFGPTVGGWGVGGCGIAQVFAKIPEGVMAIRKNWQGVPFFFFFCIFT